MEILVVEFRIKPEHVPAFEAAILENARAARETEPGCRQFDVCRDPNDPNLFVLYEVYDDEAAIATHVKTPHYLHMNASTGSWVAGKSVRKFKRIAP
jgi:quinol monooxygenase YgiN